MGMMDTAFLLVFSYSKLDEVTKLSVFVHADHPQRMVKVG